MLKYERAHPGCRDQGEIRTAFDPAYKAYVEEARARHGLTLQRAAEILEIPLDTLKKFHRFTEDRASQGRTQFSELPQEVIELANEYLRTRPGMKSVKGFCDCHPELLEKFELSYREVLYWLRRLGFVNYRGIFLKNSGLDKIIRFKPNQLWCGDGKNLDVIFNGKLFRSVWQCLVDGKTTAIVGGVIRKEENTQNLMDAIQESEQKTGIKPLGIVIDNRLSENLPAIRSALDQRGIEIVKTFPGNSKSNGIIEENFNVFDRWVGKVEISGITPEEIVRSVKQVVVEIFTQMRNRKPRRAFSFKSAKEVMEESSSATPEEEALVREKIKALADRLKNEQAQPLVSTEKKAAIAQAVAETHPPQPEVFEKALAHSRFTPDLILQSLAILKQRKAEHRERNYGHAYFGGILRKRADQQAVEHLNTHLESVYAHHWDTMGRITQEELAESLKFRPMETCTRLAADFLNMPAPAFASLILLDLKKSFLVASKGSAEVAGRLRTSITAFVMSSQKVANERREDLLCKVFEWENFVRRSAHDTGDWVSACAPAGNA